MVYEIIRSKHNVFFESLVIALLILLLGFLLGAYIESLRANRTIADYKQFEVGALDLKLQNYYFQIMDQTTCGVAIKQNLIFADKIYSSGLLIDKYEKANELSESLMLEKKRYVLLKTELWLNSMLLKKKCNNPFHTVVYLYENNANNAKDAEQSAVSDTLKELKDKEGNNIILLPIAGNLELDSVSMQMQIYNITYLPSVIIDEKTVLKGYHSLEELENYTK